MPEKTSISDKDKTRIADKMSEFFMLMGYNADFQVLIAKELNRQLWLSSENLGRKQCRELLYLLYMADSATLLSFTVSLGRLVWANHLKSKRKILKKKLVDKIKQRERGSRYSINDKGTRSKPPGIVIVKSGHHHYGFCVGSGCGVGVVRRRREVNRSSVEVGSRVFRLTLAMCFLSFRNVCVTSEWEFWAICLVKQVFGFWRSIAIGGGLSGSFACMAVKFGFDVVSCELLERLQSCFRCSSTTRYQGSGRD